MGQTRDTNTHHLDALRLRLRALRGRRSLRTLAREVHSSSSTLSRIERGQVFPDAGLIEALDRYHHQQGTLVALWQQALTGHIPPADRTPWHRKWTHHYPADYVGDVYLQLTLPPEQRPAQRRLTIRWGPWQLHRTLTIDDPAGLSCTFTKGDDGLSIPLFLTLDKRASASFGTGQPPAPSIDINHGWRRTDSHPAS
jgi:transcriptional regulator with XRE-family HTH domain